MVKRTRLGRVVCIVRGYTVTEVLEDRDEGVELVGFSVFGNGSRATASIYASAEEAMRAIDEMQGEAQD
jgi:hypothetical protein